MMVWKGDLIAGGASAPSRIARWNGTNWVDMGGGTNAAVNSLGLMPNWRPCGRRHLRFAGGTAINGVASWNGTTWSKIGAGLNNNQVTSIINDTNGDLIVSGYFTVNGSGVARWNGTAWMASARHRAAAPRRWPCFPMGLYIGGVFETAEESPRHDSARLTSGALDSVHARHRASAPVLSLGLLNSGRSSFRGTFDSVAGLANTKYFAVWNWRGWELLNSGTNNDSAVSMTTLPSGDIVAGGNFTTIGGVSANRIARWNGTAWSPLGSGLGTGAHTWSRPWQTVMSSRAGVRQRRWRPGHALPCPVERRPRGADRRIPLGPVRLRCSGRRNAQRRSQGGLRSVEFPPPTSRGGTARAGRRSATACGSGSVVGCMPVPPSLSRVVRSPPTVLHHREMEWFCGIDMSAGITSGTRRRMPTGDIIGADISRSAAIRPAAGLPGGTVHSGNASPADWRLRELCRPARHRSLATAAEPPGISTIAGDNAFRLFRPLQPPGSCWKSRASRSMSPCSPVRPPRSTIGATGPIEQCHAEWRRATSRSSTAGASAGANTHAPDQQRPARRVRTDTPLLRLRRLRRATSDRGLSGRALPLIRPAAAVVARAPNDRSSSRSRCRPGRPTPISGMRDSVNLVNIPGVRLAPTTRTLTRFLCPTSQPLGVYDCVITDICGNLTTASTLRVCLGDLSSSDGLVDDADFFLFPQAYNTLLCSDGTMPGGLSSDFNNDTVVDDVPTSPYFAQGYDVLLCP